MRAVGYMAVPPGVVKPIVVIQLQAIRPVLAGRSQNLPGVLFE